MHPMMRRALRLAERGWGRVHPNPLVGAVIVRDGEIVGDGWHAEFGGPHAEVAAIGAAGPAARGATLYVTLEPCAHRGKTPPCTDAIHAAGIREVIYAAADPTQAGGGAERLRAAGITVTGGEGEVAARRQNAAFFHWHERHSPFVALKLAVSLDARLGGQTGAPSRVTGRRARAEVQRLRAGHDAIMIGVNTAIADDPLLTARGPLVPRVPPIRVVLDSGARLPLDGRLARRCGPGDVWVLAAEEAPAERIERLEAAGVRVLRVAAGEQGLDLTTVFSRLADEGVTSVLCEGGGQLAAGLLDADAADRLYLFFAPRTYGAGGPPAFPGAPRMDPRRWSVGRLARFGRDALVVWDRRPKPGGD